MKNAKLTADKQTVRARVLNAELIDNEKTAEKSAVFCLLLFVCHFLFVIFCLPFLFVCHPERNIQCSETVIVGEGSPIPNRLQI